MLAAEIYDFIKIKLPIFYTKSALSLDVSKLPEALQKIFHLRGIKNAADVFNQAMYWVYERELQYMPAPLIKEMDGIAQGICEKFGSGW